MNRSEFEETILAAEFAARHPDYGTQTLTDELMEWWRLPPEVADRAAELLKHAAGVGLLQTAARGLYLRLRRRGHL